MLADEAGERAGAALASKIPGGAVLGSLFGSKASKKLTDTATVKAVGGWDYIKSTSDISFDSVMDLAVYMHAKHAAVDGDYAMAVAAAMGIYPRLVGAYEPALKRAFSRAEVPENQLKEPRCRAPLWPETRPPSQLPPMRGESPKLSPPIRILAMRPRRLVSSAP